MNVFRSELWDPAVRIMSSRTWPNRNSQNFFTLHFNPVQENTYVGIGAGAAASFVQKECGLESAETERPCWSLECIFSIWRLKRFHVGGFLEKRSWAGVCSSALSGACFCSSAKAVRGKSVPDSVSQEGLLFFLILQMSNNSTLQFCVTPWRSQVQIVNANVLPMTRGASGA